MADEAAPDVVTEREGESDSEEGRSKDDAEFCRAHAH